MARVPRPTVSVCIPTHNGAPYLERAIASVLAQTFADFELLVVDDRSSDASPAIARSFTDPRVRCVANELRRGLVANWNRCLELAGGEHVAIFHQDDVMMPENLADKVGLLQAHPAVGMVHSNVHQIGPADELIAESWYTYPTAEEDGVHPGLAYLRRMLTGLNPVCAPSVVLRRECYERLGGFDGRLPFTADWEMWMRIAAFYDIGYRIRPLMAYRRHPDMESARFRGARELEQGYRAKMLVLEKVGGRMPDADALRRHVIDEHRHLAVERARQAQAAGHADEVLRYLVLAREIWTAGAGDGGAGDAEALRRWEREVYHARVAGGLSPEEIVRQVPGATLVAALRRKLVARARASRLYRLARRLLTGRAGRSP
jgi:glycosyltransferase involved in cell wall biosynthesis